MPRSVTATSQCFETMAFCTWQPMAIRLACRTVQFADLSPFSPPRGESAYLRFLITVESTNARLCCCESSKRCRCQEPPLIVSSQRHPNIIIPFPPSALRNLRRTRGTLRGHKGHYSSFSSHLFQENVSSRRLFQNIFFFWQCSPNVHPRIDRTTALMCSGSTDQIGLIC